MTPTNRNTAFLPIASLLVAATLWGVFWYPLRLLEAAGLVGIWATLTMYCAVLSLFILISWRKLADLRVAPGWLFALALAAGWTNVSFILAVLEGTIVRVLLLFYLSPLWSVVLGRMFLGERLSPRARVVFVVAVIGALIMLWDPEMGMPWPRDYADWLALSSGFAFSINNIIVRHLQGVNITTKTLSSWAGVVLIATIWVLLDTQAAVPLIGWQPWLAAAILGCILLPMMTFSVQYGVTHMPVYRSAVILLFELVAGAASAYWLTDEVVYLREWIGGALIMFAAYLAARLQLQEQEHG